MSTRMLQLNKLLLFIYSFIQRVFNNKNMNSHNLLYFVLWCLKMKTVSNFIIFIKILQRLNFKPFSWFFVLRVKFMLCYCHPSETYKFYYIFCYNPCCPNNHSKYDTEMHIHAERAATWNDNDKNFTSQEKNMHAILKNNSNNNNKTLWNLINKYKIKSIFSYHLQPFFFTLPAINFECSSIAKLLEKF